MNEILKTLKSVQSDQKGVAIVIDETNGWLEIDGDRDLKNIIFEVSSYVIKRWKATKNKNRDETEHVIPEGAQFWLPYLPPCGIDKMTLIMVELYWSKVMRQVCQDRGRNLAYDSNK